MFRLDDVTAPKVNRIVADLTPKAACIVIETSLKGSDVWYQIRVHFPDDRTWLIEDIE